MLVDLIDPSPVPLRQAPRDADSWVTAASGSWVVALDNLSAIPPWLSDSLCRAATGDGNVKRALYTDADLAVLKFRRCVIVNGIDVGAVRPISRSGWPRWNFGVSIVTTAGPRPRCARNGDRLCQDSGRAPRPGRRRPAAAGNDLRRRIATHGGLGPHPGGRRRSFGHQWLSRFLSRADQLSEDSLVRRPLHRTTAPADTRADRRPVGGDLLAITTPVGDHWRRPKNGRRTAGMSRQFCGGMRRRFETWGGSSRTMALGTTGTCSCGRSIHRSKIRRRNEPRNPRAPRSRGSTAAHPPRKEMS